MSRRTALTTRQGIDLVQRRRTRDLHMYSESPTPLDIRRLPGVGEGGSQDPGSIVPVDVTWLSTEIDWVDMDGVWLL